jgi:hypothetical protein
VSFAANGEKYFIQMPRVTRLRAPTRADERRRWLSALSTRGGKHRAAVALAKKHARMVWALLAYNQADHVRTV